MVWFWNAPGPEQNQRLEANTRARLLYNNVQGNENAHQIEMYPVYAQIAQFCVVLNSWSQKM